MAFTAPTISASGQTFAELQTLGFDGYVIGVATANSATVTQLTLIQQLLHRVQGSLPALRTRAIVHAFLSGEPVTVASVDGELGDLAFAFAVLHVAIDEIGALVDANPGTIGTVIPTGIGVAKQVRTW